MVPLPKWRDDLGNRFPFIAVHSPAFALRHAVARSTLACFLSAVNLLTSKPSEHRLELVRVLPRSMALQCPRGFDLCRLRQPA